MARAGRREDISLSGLTRGEAKEFNKLFLLSFVIFTLIAVVAHYLVWIWRPWLQMGAPTAQTGMLDAVRPLLTLVG
ncbi:MAG: light-harvesting protein [Parafilimonas terrae]|nr:light-harvesting protein [Parafilimonas terrae]